MNFKYPFFFLAGIIVMAGITPFAMSQVGQTEPSMEIDMIAGQTQNPFRIQTYEDNNIFCVNPDGGSCAGIPFVTLVYQSDVGEILTTENKGVISGGNCEGNDIWWNNMTATDLANSDCILAELHVYPLDPDKPDWRLDEVSSNDYLMDTGMLMINGDLRRVSGTGTCLGEVMSWDSGSGDVYFSTMSFGTISTTNANWTPDRDTIEWNSEWDRMQYRFTIGANNQNTVCEFKNLNIFLEIADYGTLDFEWIK